MQSKFNVRKGVSNRYLEDLIYKTTTSDFRGVFPKNHINQISIFDGEASLVINTDLSFHKGSHFVGIIKKHDKIYYFDSLAQEIPNFIQDFLLKFNLPIIKSQTKIQADISEFCSFYCLGFILSDEIGINLQRFTSLFFRGNEENLLLNDQLIIFLIKSAIRQMK